MNFDCDVAVIGGGPAGSTAAAWLARHGHRVMVFERDRFPRFHIGESLLASVNDVLEAIGAADLIRAEQFPAKWGATFMTPDGSVERFADFAIAREKWRSRRPGRSAASGSTTCCCVMPRTAAQTCARVIECSTCRSIAKAWTSTSRTPTPAKG